MAEWVEPIDRIEFPEDTAALRASTDPLTLSWLDERQSMTLRLKKHCKNITVAPTAEYDAGLRLAESFLFPGTSSFWVRDVVMYGDDVPYLSARTTLPQSTVDAIDIPIKTLGTTPIGKYLFADPSVLMRVAVHLGSVMLAGSRLAARRSLFKYKGHPFCLTELFLPQGPAYPRGKL